MAESTHDVAAGDEGRHAPEADPLWNESVYLDLVDASGSVGAYLRLGLYPNLEVAWWTAAVVGPDRKPVLATAYDLPVAADGFCAGSGPDSIAITCPDPLTTCEVVTSTEAVCFDDAADPYHGRPGSPRRLELDLTFRTDGVPYHYGLTTRYEIPCLVEGTITIDGDVQKVAGPGQRDHSWGVRDWWAFSWCWSAVRLDDGTRLHLADIRLPGFPPLGYVQRDGAVEPLDQLEVTELLGEEQFPTEAQLRLSPGGYDLAVTPIAYGPLLLTAPDGRVSRFPRAMVQVEGGGRHGVGWIEWNQPQQ